MIAKPGDNSLRNLTDQFGILYGGDYNPEQWDREVWLEDVELMRAAGVNLVTVGVFSWARYEPQPGVRDFAWLDEVLDLLHNAGIAVDLATPTASPPPWLGIQYPETLPVTADGVRLSPGSRNQFSPSSQVYRERALAITKDLAERYVNHPAVRMWHIGNEYGQVDYGPEAEREFRDWLTAKYQTIDNLNKAWGTTFWSQHYGSFTEILPPRAAPYLINPTQSLDFKRFGSDQMLRCYREQYQIIRRAGGKGSITTNFMGFFPLVDGWAWAPNLDVVSDDQYPDPGDPNSPMETALVQDLARGLGGGAPWVLMEQAAAHTSWREHNLPKTPARLRLDSLQAVARGADAICFFQWRASVAGAERFHSAMLPHAGPDTAVHQGIRRLGADLQRLRAIVGELVPARVALVFDWESWWAFEELGRITTRLRTLEILRSWYAPLWRAGIAVDIVRPEADLTSYDVVLLPQTYLWPDGAALSLQRAASGGASVVVGPMSAVADANAHIIPGRFPVPLAGLLGVSGEEWVALPDDGVTVTWESGSDSIELYAAQSRGPQSLVAWAPTARTQSEQVSPDDAAAPTRFGAQIHGEQLRADGAQVLARFSSGFLTGGPAVTKNQVGSGHAYYVGGFMNDALISQVLADALAAAGVTPLLPDLADSELEVVQRGPALFLLNRGDTAITVNLPGNWQDLLTDDAVTNTTIINPQDARVLFPN